MWNIPLICSLKPTTGWKSELCPKWYLTTTLWIYLEVDPLMKWSEYRYLCEHPFSKIKWQSISMCLVWTLNIELLANEIAEMLPHHKIDGVVDGTWRTQRIFHIQKRSAVVVARERYSISIKEHETVCYFLVD